VRQTDGGLTLDSACLVNSYVATDISLVPAPGTRDAILHATRSTMTYIRNLYVDQLSYSNSRNEWLMITYVCTRLIDVNGMNE
jgi:hypothetical protein